MLVLTRCKKQVVKIGHDIEVSLVEIRGTKVKLGIRAPKTVEVHRLEIYRELHESQVEINNKQDSDDRLKILRELGFVPYTLAMYKDTLIEIIGYPYIDNEQYRIKVRLEVGNPESMQSVEVSEVWTIDMVKQEPEKMIDLLRLMKPYFKTR